MPSDLRSVFRKSAWSPSGTYDAEVLWRRGRRRLWAVRTVSVASAIVLVGGIYTVSSNFGAFWFAQEDIVAGTPEQIQEQVGLDPKQCGQDACIAVENFPGSIVATTDAIWVANTAHDGEWTATRINPSDNEAVAYVPLGGAAEDLAAGMGYLWAVVETHLRGSQSRWELVGIDAVTNRRTVDSIPIGGDRVGEHDIAVGEGFVWITGPEGLLYRYQPSSEVMESFELASHAKDYGIADGPMRVAVGNGAVWLGTNSGSILRVDPSTGRPLGDPAEVGHNVTGITVGYDRVWATQQTPHGREQMSVVDAKTGAVARPPIELIDAIVNPPVVGLGAIWVLQGDYEDEEQSRLVRVDGETERLSDVIPVRASSSFSGLDVGADAAWVVGGKLSAQSSTVLRIEP